MTFPSIISWNCRGASSSRFFQHLSELIKTNKPDILILLETRCASTMVETIYRKTYMNNTIVFEACGFAGGIWIFWDNSSLQLESLSIHDQIVNVLVW